MHGLQDASQQRGGRTSFSSSAVWEGMKTGIYAYGLHKYNHHLIRQCKNVESVYADAK